MRARTFFIMQYERHPNDGKPLLDEDKIIDALNHRTITHWAYIAHDKDKFSADDEASNPEHKAGNAKPRHWHIAVQCKNNAVEVSTIAKWFGIPENFVDVPKGAGAFMDCVMYLTHESAREQEKGKYRYPDTDVRANFEWRTELDRVIARKLRYGKDLGEKDALRNEVMYHGMTLRYLSEHYPLALQNDLDALRKFRLYYIDRHAPMPKTRINYYVQGSGGVGKGLICRALARAIYFSDPNNIKKDKKEIYDDDIFFEVGADKTAFEGYDGQPIIIWNDCRAYTLLQKLGGRENVFNVFDPHPPEIRQNIKYGSIRLTNKVNLVNSVDPWAEFLDGLAGEYKTTHGETRHAEDKNQSRRRFPFFIVLHEEDYDIGMNKGLFYGTREFDQYMMYQGLRCNMRKIAQKCGENLALRNELETQAVKPVVGHHYEMVDVLEHGQEGTDDEIRAEFADYGSPTNPEMQPIVVNLDADSKGGKR